MMTIAENYFFFQYKTLTDEFNKLRNMKSRVPLLITEAHFFNSVSFQGVRCHSSQQIPFIFFLSANRYVFLREKLDIFSFSTFWIQSFRSAKIVVRHVSNKNFGCLFFHIFLSPKALPRRQCRLWIYCWVFCWCTSSSFPTIISIISYFSSNGH